MRLASLTLMLSASALLAAADEKPAKEPEAREIKLTGGELPERAGAFDKPTKITDKDELAKAVPNKTTREGIAKQVDFDKEYVLLFAWSGSGGDRVGMKVEKGEATFTFKAGLTDDLRRHAKLFALPKKMTYKIAK